MDRRTALATVVGLASGTVAGCTRLRALTEPSTDDRIVSIAAVDTVPATHDIELSVELVDDTSTAASPAQIAVSTTNQGQRRALSVAPGKCSLFNRRAGGSDDPPGLWLHDPGRRDHISTEGDRWVADRPPDQPRAFPDYGCLPKTYAHGETLSNDYDIWDDYREPGYMLPDTYRWVQDVRVYDADDDSHDELGSFDWGFTLRIDPTE